jgi:outer membrane protein assembly factor BamB
LQKTDEEGRIRPSWRLCKDRAKYKRANEGGAATRKGKLTGKILGIVLVFAMIGAMLGGLPILVGEAEASPATIYVPDDYETIQAAKGKANSSGIPSTIDSDRDNYSLVELSEPYGTGAIGAWPMFRHDPQHTGRSPYTGPETPSLKWSYATEYAIASSPAIGSDGTIYVGGDGVYFAGSYDNRLYAIEPDGTLKWSYATEGAIHSSPAIGPDGTIYVGGDGSGSIAHYLYAINPDGSLKWSYATCTGCKIHSSPAIGSDGTIYVGSKDKKIHAINPDGTLKWSYPTENSIDSSPAIDSEGTIYVGSNDYELYAINPSGTLKWSFATGYPVTSSPVIGSDGTIYVGSNDQKIYAINSDGTLKWSYFTGGAVTSSPAISLDGTIYAGSQDDKLYALNPDGTLKWTYTTGNIIDSSPAIDAKGTIYIGSYDCKLYAINSDGTIKWSYGATHYISSSPAIGSDGTVYVGSQDGKLYAIGIGIRDIRQPISSISFGDMTVGSSLDKITTIHNDGTAALTINSITRSSGSSDFTHIGPSTPFSIVAGGSSTITVRFAPSSTDSKSATFNVNSNDPDEANVPFIVSGNGVANNPPNMPSNPSPSNHTTGVPVNADLSWSGGDPDAGDAVTYDVYFGISSSPPLVYSDQSASTYNLGALNPNTKHYWKIVATDNHGASATGPLWDFTTATEQEEVTLTLYVHEGSTGGPIIVGAQVTGQDGAGNSFSQTTSSNGYVTLAGAPGTWSFIASKTGYQTNSWSQSIATTGEKHAYLQYEGQIPEQVVACSLPPPTLISPTQGAAGMALRPTFSWSSVSGANRYWLVVATDKNMLSTNPADEFCEVYYMPTEGGGLERVTLYYPAYYNSIVVRLYNFDGKAVVPMQSIVISYEEKATSGGQKYKEITGAQSFSSYEDAQAYVASQTSGNYRIVGTNPLSSPIPLEELGGDLTSVPSAVISDVSLISTSYTPPSNLNHSTTYWWQVQAFNWDGNKVVQLGQYSAQHSLSTEQEEVTLTLYVHEGGASGPIIAGAQVTGQDGAGNSFDQTTNASGYVTITGVPGTWSFTASKTGYNANSWSQDITSTCAKRAHLTLAGWPNCIMILEQCQSGVYIDPHLPLCWEISGVGVGDSFSICAGNSTASNGIKEVRFSSDDTQDGAPNGQWTEEWYDWNTSSGDWSAETKSMSWSFSTGGNKEVWVELEDNAGQTSQCFKEIAAVPLPEWFELPDTITLDEFAVSSFAGSIAERIAQEGGVIDSFPIFLSGKLEFSNQPINIVLVCSPHPPTLYKLVRIKTNLVQDPRYIELVATMESSSVVGCVWNTLVSQTILNWISHPGQTVLEKLAKAMADSIIRGAGLSPLISTALITYGSILDCVENGYSDKLEGFEDGRDYLVYLPIGYDFTIRAQRGFDPCQFQASVTTVCSCPPPVQGMRQGTILETMNDINLEIREIPAWFCKIFSPGELSVYDSRGRITGLVDGQIRQEIPDSEYDETNKAVTVFSPEGPLVCKIVGTSDGTYDLFEGFFEDGETMAFAILDIPMTNGTTHQYSVNWETFPEGEEGVTMQIDSDNDGVFEETKTLRPPIASFAFSPSNVSVNEEIDFDASQSSDADGEIVSYQWNFGDENTSTGSIVTHAYSAQSKYTVSLVVVGNDGEVSSYSRIIQVGEGQGMPTWGWAIIVIGLVVLAVVVIGRRRRPA